jgi:hypothetical protein
LLTQLNSNITNLKFRFIRVREEGEDRLGQLVSVLISKGRSEDVQRAATNKEARKRLYEEFNMK